MPETKRIARARTKAVMKMLTIQVVNCLARSTGLYAEANRKVQVRTATGRHEVGRLADTRSVPSPSGDGSTTTLRLSAHPIHPLTRMVLTSWRTNRNYFEVIALKN